MVRHTLAEMPQICNYCGRGFHFVSFRVSFLDLLAPHSQLYLLYRLNVYSYAFYPQGSALRVLLPAAMNWVLSDVQKKSDVLSLCGFDAIVLE